jgi:Holliday junction resolvase
MKPKSIIEKGKKFERQIAEAIMQEGLGLARREVGSGSGKRKGDIASNLPFLIEAKNHRTLKIPEWIRQAKEQARIGNSNPDKWCLVFKEPKSPDNNPEMIAVIDFYQLLNLLKKNEEPKIKAPDKTLKWDLMRLKEIANKIIKEL